MPDATATAQLPAQFPDSALDTLNMANARAALAQGVSAIRAGQTEFDLAQLTTVDSAAVSVLLSWQRAARAAGSTVSYVNMPANLRSLATLYGVEALLADASAPAPADQHHH
ncbi:MAG: STAS domain-containing protein [Pseudomonadota bacterium]